MGKKWSNLRSYWNKPQRAAYLFLLPAAVLILVFNIIPLFASFFISMLDRGISFDSAKFIGLDNFKEALTDRRFVNSLIVTLKFTVIEVPIQMVLGLVLSAMQNVPGDYYEAADIDGAGKIRQFFSITLPSIMPSFWFLLMTRVIGSLQVFDLVFTLTDGGPNYTTETLVTYVYNRAFDVGNRMGYATAMSEFLFLIIMVITLIQYRIMKKTEY